MSRPSFCVINGTGPADVVLQFVSKLRLESWHRCENAHTDGVIRPVPQSVSPLQIRRHMDRSGHVYQEDHKRSLFRTPRMNAAIFSASLMPLAASTPLDTSTAQGWARWIASATFPGAVLRTESAAAVSLRNQIPVKSMSCSTGLAFNIGIQQQPSCPIIKGCVL